MWKCHNHKDNLKLYLVDANFGNYMGLFRSHMTFLFGFCFCFTFQVDLDFVCVEKVAFFESSE